MWRKTGKFILKYRLVLLIGLAVVTAFFAYRGSQVTLGYEFTKAIPTNHPVNKAYKAFRKKYGEDGNMLVVGVQTNRFFNRSVFNDYARLQRALKNAPGVEDVISVPNAVNIVKNEASEKLEVHKIFADSLTTQAATDSAAVVFKNLPFYRGLIYNPQTEAYIMGLRMNADVINSAQRDNAIDKIKSLTEAFSQKHQIDVKLSGLPYIRTVLASRIANEMRYFLIASILLSAAILLLFFRAFSSMLLSLGVVIIGVLFSLGTMHLFGYNITLLTALIPPLIVVIGIPNCIYFLNKYHSAWYSVSKNRYNLPKGKTFNEQKMKQKAIVDMISKMGVVTLFCNLAAAIGFAVFALTKSEILQEFGVVAGINIMLLFFISLVLIPPVLSFLPVPKNKHTKYLHNPRINRWLNRLEKWSLGHRRQVYVITAIVVLMAGAGILRLKSNAFMVDDLPKTDKIYADLKFFEQNFKGIMPLEVVVDTKKKYGITRSFSNLQKLDSLTQYLASMPQMARPLSLVEGLKFARQAFYEGDSANYAMPTEFDLPGLQQYLNMSGTAANGESAFNKLLATFMDSARQEARVSINMADIGSHRLPALLQNVQQKLDSLFPKDRYSVTLTGSSIAFQEGSRFIINGLWESILWAFLLIALCMLYLFRSFRILMCSLIPNLIPLVITAGVMGWAGVPLKPGTVLIFSVALGIAIDITIRFLVNYKQELPYQPDIRSTVIQTIHSTGISIIYTSMVLTAGFIIFCFSSFGGTQALGWLTSLTLITATFTNLILLPALLISFTKKTNRTA